MILNGMSSLVLVVLTLPLLALAAGQFTWRWAAAKILMGTAVVLALCSCLGLVIFGVSASSTGWFHSNALVCTVLLLISFISWVVLRYAASNFEMDASGKRFLRWFLCTVFAVMCVVASQHLVVFWLAWVCISLSFHQLLMFYPSRPRAALAAHKKFLLARIAETLLAIAFLLLWREHGSVDINVILSHYPVQTLNGAEQAAAVLIAIVALIKCAQLPVHGWLIQVVESPTPVSALLHAGVINLGGFLLIVFAPLFSQSFVAQVLVLLVAGLSMLTAALVMMTRISIKVRLAWSTNAQMGLMLVECALGLYELALLHMLAHACYKAFAFLDSGNAVSDYLRSEYVQRRLPTLRAWFLSAVISLTGIGLLVSISAATIFPLSPWLMLWAALSVFLAQQLSVRGFKHMHRGILGGVLLLGIYWLMKTLLAPVIPVHLHQYSGLEDAWVGGLFAVLCSTYLVLLYRAQGALSHQLFIALNAGFYLDEWLTRATLKLWPIQLPRIRDIQTNPKQGVV